MIRITYLIGVLCFFGSSILAQSKSIKGSVFDKATKTPIPFSTIAVFYDSLLIDGTSADNLGVFQLKPHQKWSHIQVSFIGYGSLIKTKEELQNEENIILYLSRQEEWLKQIVISERKTTELKIDRKVINLESDIQTQLGKIKPKQLALAYSSAA